MTATDAVVTRRRHVRLPRTFRGYALLLALIVVGYLIWCLVMLVASMRAGYAGRDALVEANVQLGEEHTTAATSSLDDAQQDFDRMRGHLHAMGPGFSIARHIPFVRMQIRALDTFADAGSALAVAGHRATRAAQPLVDLEHAEHKAAGGLTAALTPLAHLRDELAGIDTSLAAIAERVHQLDDDRLVWPLNGYHSDLEDKLGVTRERLASLHDTAAAVVAFSGGDGDRRWLLLSQNPDEVRPVGGFIGAYAVISASAGHLTVTDMAPIENWYHAHPSVAIPVRRAPTALKLSSPPIPQTIANVNTTPDWPTAARLAMRMWSEAGEKPVDGVIGVTPDLLARLLSTLGIVTVPGYPDTVTASNLVELTDRYTHREASPSDSASQRKRFVTEVASAVLSKTLGAPASKWQSLGLRLSAAMNADEGMIAADDPAVARLAVTRHWDGAFELGAGDVFAAAEFEYAAKNGRGLVRSLDHVVQLHADGSGVATTTYTVRNTEAPDPRFNIDSRSYITVYGPVGGVLNTTSDPPVRIEAAIDGHPAAGYIRAADPRGSTSFKASWTADGLLQPCGSGCLLYRLQILGVRPHHGDVLHLSVTPPHGWTWITPPPRVIKLHPGASGEWRLRHTG